MDTRIQIPGRVTSTRHGWATWLICIFVAVAGLRTTAAGPSLIAAGSAWKYLDTGANLGTAWRTVSFNDGAWASGSAPLGYGEMNVGVWPRTTNSFGPDPNNKYITTYYRQSFLVTNPAAYGWLQGRLLRDDGAVVYLNGAEVFRSNMPTGAVNYATLATSAAGAAEEITFFPFTVEASTLRLGTNVLAVEIHQAAANSSDIAFDLSLLGVTPGESLSWDNGSGTGNWNADDLNWSGMSWNNQAAPGALFGALGAGPVILTADVTASSLTFSSAGYVISGGSLGLVGLQAITNHANATIASPIISGALNKWGAGTLTLSGVNTYPGGTVVSAGTLQLAANGGSCPIVGTLTVNPGASVVTTGDGTGLGFSGGRKITTLHINGGTVSSAGTVHIWNLSGGVNMTGGALQSNGGISSPTGSQLEWGDTAVNTFPSGSISVIAGRINLRADSGSANSSLLTCDVADGPAAPDLLISAALTQSGRPPGSSTGGNCGLVKKGAGTLRLTGAVLLTGWITVESGTLELAPSAMNTQTRISVASGARLRLSNAATNVLKNVYVDGLKLGAGRWGAPGSVAAGLAEYESPVISGPGILQISDATLSNRERWKRMKYGQFTHYIYFGVNPDGSSFSDLEYAANNFNAPRFADDLASMGVEYVIFTAWHANFFPLFNSAAVARALGFKRNSSRDVVGDMIAAVRAKGIRVILYAHPNQPVIYNAAGHNSMLNDCYGEMMDRYGDQIDGFWLDENDPGGNQDGSVDYPRLERTVRLRNPDAVLIQNFYGNLYACDVGASEWGPPSVANLSPDIGVADTQSASRPMAPGWNTTRSTNSYAARYSAEGIFRATVLAAGSCADGGGINWAAGPYPGGGWEQGVLETMQAAGALIAPVAESIKNTFPSDSWITPGGTTIPNLPYGIVATRSTDDTKEYIHVLNPPGSGTLTLPAPADQKAFANARLLFNGSAVTLGQNGRAVQLSLTGTNTWSATDTVIALDVVSAGDRYLANNTTPDAVYSGSWVYQPNRGTTEFCRDVHETTVNGDSVEFAFSGTDIELLGTGGPHCGSVNIYLDGVFQQTVSAQTSSPQYRKVLYSQAGLLRGKHTLKAVKTGGTSFIVDAFRASELIDSTQSDIAYQALTFFNDTATASNALGYIEYDANWSYQRRDGNEYNSDAHWAQWNGSTFRIHFDGTGVQFVGLKGGIVDFYLDDVFIKQLNLNEPGTYSRNVGLDINGLPAGWHTLKGVKVGDTYVHVDAFFVYNGRNSSWTGQSDSNAFGGSWQRSLAYNDVATLSFQGSGLELIAPHTDAGGTVGVRIQGAAYRNIASTFVSQYAGESRPQRVSFSSRPILNLAPGNYFASFWHNRSFGSIGLDAVRVYKSVPGSGAPFVWDVGGVVGSGTWDAASTANWSDGRQKTRWYDFGGLDYAALFQGPGGTVSLASSVNVNRLIFKTTGYTLRNSALNLTGSSPTIDTAIDVNTTIQSLIVGSAGLNKSGPGTLTLTAANTYTGGTTVGAGILLVNGSLAGGAVVSGGALGGAGTIKGPVTVKAGGLLAPGGSMGTLVISHTLTLSSGSLTLIEINAASGARDQVRGLTTVNYGGTLVVTNLTGNVTAGQSFKLFTAASYTGNFVSIAGPQGTTWNFNPSNGVLTAVAVVATNPININFEINSTGLALSWPVDHTGWTLMAQTNNVSAGLSLNWNDWMRVPGSAAKNRVVIPIVPGAPGGYYRLVYP